MTDIAARAQLHRRRIRDAVEAYEANQTAENWSAVKHALHAAEARLIDHFGLEPLEAQRSGGGGKPPTDPNDDAPTAG